MKILVCLFATIVSANAFADDGLSWTKQIISAKGTPDSNNEPSANFYGKTAEDGQVCALFLTDKAAGDYFVVVGLKETNNDPKDFIGVGVGPDSKQTDTKLSSNSAYFHAHESWGNSSSDNAVTVALDASGSPVSATGVSDVRTITCLGLVLGK